MVWGTSGLLLRIVAPITCISLTIGTRLLIEALVLIFVASLTGQFPNFKKLWKAYMFLGAFNIVIPFALVTYTIMELNASYAAILGATTPLFTVAAARYWMNEKITFNKIAGIFISIAGLVVFFVTNPYAAHANFWLAVLAGLGGSFFYAVSSVYANIKFKCSSPVQTVGGQLIMASVMVLPFMFANFQPVLLSPRILIPLLVLAVICTAGGYILYFKLIASAGSVQASFVTILVPIFSVLWASIFLHEKITSIMLLGLAFVVLGIFLVVYKKSRRYAAVLKPIRGAKYFGELSTNSEKLVKLKSSNLVLEK